MACLPVFLVISCFIIIFFCDFLFVSLDGTESAVGLWELLLELIPILKECVHGDDRVAVHLFVLLSFYKNKKNLYGFRASCLLPCMA